MHFLFLVATVVSAKTRCWTENRAMRKDASDPGDRAGKGSGRKNRVKEKKARKLTTYAVSAHAEK